MQKFFFVTIFAITILCESSYSQIELSFCPITKTQSNKSWKATIKIKNNTGVTLDLFNNNFNMDWPSLKSLIWPFSDIVQKNENWSFRIQPNWPGTVAPNSTITIVMGGSYSGSTFTSAFQLPHSGTFKQGGKTYSVSVTNCNQTQNYEIYNSTFSFDRDCFIKSPTSNLCFGEGASEIWKSGIVTDIMVPVNRPSWAIANMVAHRLFTNLVGAEMISPNFWTAIAMLETRMACSSSATPNVKNYCGILGCSGTDLVLENCFQLLNIGYNSAAQNQPNLFSQTNTYGTTNFKTVVDSGKYESGALAVAHYHYQNFKYWNEIFCTDIKKVFTDAKDPYAIEKILYHTYHDGPNAGITLLNNISSNYVLATGASNMNSIITTPGTWSLGSSGSQTLANITSLLDGGNSKLYPENKTNFTTEYYGCYQKNISWNDILYYLNEIKILYPHIMNSFVKDAIKVVFDGINTGNDVNFTLLGPVIDEIVIQMGGHDPSIYLAQLYAASKTCTKNPIGLALKCTDTICNGEKANLELWLSGDTLFNVKIQYPDGSVHEIKKINYSPYIVQVTQPGEYEIIEFKDSDETGNIDCNTSTVRIPSRNGVDINWDKSNFDVNKNCATGDLYIKKYGGKSVSVNYSINGKSQSNLVLNDNEQFKLIATNLSSENFIINDIVPNACNLSNFDTISFCNVITTLDDQLIRNNELRAFPNPTSNKVQVSNSVKNICSVTGQIIIEPSLNERIIDISYLISGTYIINYQNGKSELLIKN